MQKVRIKVPNDVELEIVREDYVDESEARDNEPDNAGDDVEDDDAEDDS